MKITKHQILLESSDSFGREVPSEALAPFFRLLPRLVRASVRMTFEGGSVKGGAIPAWLQASSDMRFCGFGEDRKGATALVFGLPHLGDAAPELFKQRNLFADAPSDKATGLDLLANALSDIEGEEKESRYLDEGFLNVVSKMKPCFERGFNALVLPGSRRIKRAKLRVGESIVQSARELQAHTPRPQALRVLGELDSLTNSTQRLSLLMRDGRRVNAILTKGRPEDHADLFGKKVLVQGRAIYRPSGSLLRIDVDTLQEGANQPSLFETIPEAKPLGSTLVGNGVLQSKKRGAKALFGSWPGDESDEELIKILQEMS